MDVARMVVSVGLVWACACGERSAAGSTGTFDAGVADARTLDAGRDSGARDAGPDASATLSSYAAVEAIVRRSCAFMSCHGGTSAGKARLNFANVLAAGESLTTVLNGVTSCEYPRMPLVAPSAPDASWLMVKLTADHDAEGKIEFVPDSAWDAGIGSEPTASSCPLVEDGALSFGKLMPINGTRSQALSAEEIEAFRVWIAAGAPAQ